MLVNERQASPSTEDTPVTPAAMIQLGMAFGDQKPYSAPSRRHSARVAGFGLGQRLGFIADDFFTDPLPRQTCS